MFHQYFGRYLLNNELLSPEQLSDVLTLERSVRPKLGVLAIDAGLMTAAQVAQVHQLQHTMDKKFGEIAVERGCLTVGQLEELLATQQSKRLSLSQAIIDKGYLSLAQLESALDNYKKESNLTPSQLEALQKADFDGFVRAFLDFSAAGTKANILYNYVALMLRNIVRFVGEEPVIGSDDSKVEGWMVSQEMNGTLNLFTSLILGEQPLLKMAQSYSGEPISEVNAFSQDCVAEFLNETNGIFTVNMSDNGLELDLQPQQIHTEKAILEKNVFHVPLRTVCGPIDLYIGLK